ncbi:sulfite exporter TauE/SafE family protein, partial [Aliarcobacter butzleri]
LIPMLLDYGFMMQEAVAKSIMQMVFSSIYGSIINAKTTKGLLRDGTILGVGASIVGMVSGSFLTSIPDIYLTNLFIASLL